MRPTSREKKRSSKPNCESSAAAWPWEATAQTWVEVTGVQAKVVALLVEAVGQHRKVSGPSSIHGISEFALQCLQRLLTFDSTNQHADPHFTGKDQLQVDAGQAESLEHADGHFCVAP